MPIILLLSLKKKFRNLRYAILMKNLHMVFPAPFVRESQVKIGMKLVESIPVELNKNYADNWQRRAYYRFLMRAIDSEGHINLQRTASVGISGLNTYYSLRKEEKVALCPGGRNPPTKNQFRMHEKSSIYHRKHDLFVDSHFPGEKNGVPIGPK
jgi:hypothetical protein